MTWTSDDITVTEAKRLEDWVTRYHSKASCAQRPTGGERLPVRRPLLCPRKASGGSAAFTYDLDHEYDAWNDGAGDEYEEGEVEDCPGRWILC